MVFLRLLANFSPQSDLPRRRIRMPNLLYGGVLVFGFLIRLGFAKCLFLNPDEAWHYLLSVQPSLHAAYQAALTTAHPPLLILFLHYWSRVGTSELVLRLPGVFAGIAFCWITVRWLELIIDRETSRLALPIVAFAPPLISLSAEVRQYWLLLLFVAAALYCLERGMLDRSKMWMLGFSTSLCLALFSHYSAAFFALSMGIYGVFAYVNCA